MPKRPRPDLSSTSPEPFRPNPFGELAKLRDVLPAAAPPPKIAPERKGPARAVVRMERKGHGGKEVTVVEQLELGQKDLEKWLKELKGALGCGGTIEGRDLILQGDQRDRLPAILEKRGVRKISIG